jgi:NTP pyrophosphatase (non-canonical NTP hydrolase)
VDLVKLQQQVDKWHKYNFGGENDLENAIDNLLGVSEEVGELCHAILKHKQGIRKTENHLENAKDAVGDIVIFLLNFCNRMEFSFSDCVQNAWDEVKDRDWVKYPGKGRPDPEETVPLYNVEVVSNY